MQISSDLEEVDYQLRSSSEDFPRRKGSIQCCDFVTFQEGSNQKLGLAHEDLGNGRGEGLARQPNQGTEVTTWLQPREAYPAFRSCARIGKQAADRGPDSTSGKDTSVEVWNFNEVHSVTTLSISPTQAGEKFFPGVGDGYVP